MKLWSLNLVTPPAEEPVTLEDAILQARVDDSAAAAEGSRILSMISSEREVVEHQTGRQLVTATWELLLDRFPGLSSYAIAVPRPPLLSVVSITYIDDAGAPQTLDPAKYLTLAPAGPRCQRGIISLAYGQSWPSVQSGRRGAVTIKFTAGYGPAAAVPAALREAILLRFAERYDRRTDQTVGTTATKNLISSEALAWPYRDFGSLFVDGSC